MTSLKIIENIIATRKFERGPAKEIKAASRLGFFKLKGSNGTGFAQPKGMTGIPMARMTTRTRRRVVPTGS